MNYINNPVLVLKINLTVIWAKLCRKKFAHSTVYRKSCNFVLAQNEKGCVIIIRYIIFFILFKATSEVLSI